MRMKRTWKTRQYVRKTYYGVLLCAVKLPPSSGPEMPGAGRRPLAARQGAAGARGVRGRRGGGRRSHGPHSHHHAALCVSLVSLYRKYKGRCDNDFTAHG
jgi:hypothetical protein